MKYIINLYLNLSSYLMEAFLKLELSAYSSDGSVLTEEIYGTQAEHAARKYYEYLSKRLKKFPYWLKGHIKYSTLALSFRDVELAFASAMAAKELLANKSKKSKNYTEMLYLLARCYLASAEYGRAVTALEELVEIKPSKASLEELAAAYIANEDHDAALKMFNKIGVDNLSPDAKAALEYIQFKLQA